MYRICMYLWGVAVLELDSHPDQKKGPGQRTFRWSKDPSHRSEILVILLMADNQSFDCISFIWMP